MIADYTKSITSDYGTIGENVKIINAGTIRNVNIGQHATIENCTRLENGTVNSNKEAPVYIGDSVIAQDFIISSGAVIADAAKIIRCFIGQACHVSHNFRLTTPYCSVTVLLRTGRLVPSSPSFTVSMHKSSLPDCRHVFVSERRKRFEPKQSYV